jgi:succinate dehydrogenase/fumarate reductase cytochrome b subunit
MCVLSFPITFVWKSFHSKRNSARYFYKCTHVFMWSTRYSCQFLIKHKLSQHVFEKYSNAMKICLVWAELFCADGLTDVMKLIVTFHNFFECI